MYTPAAGGGARQRGVVLCHPFGQEYLRAHRSVRYLERQLAASGLHVLRFDYGGTGDSDGCMSGSSLSDWEADIATAIDELKETSDLAKVSLVGLRLGAALAARVAVRRPRDIDLLVLWDPVIDGATYVDELFASESARRGGPPLRRGAASGGGHEILGYPFTEALERDLRTVDTIATLRQARARIAMITSAPDPAGARLNAARAEAGEAPAVVEYQPGESVWVSDPLLGAGAVPVRLLQKLAGLVS